MAGRGAPPYRCRLPRGGVPVKLRRPIRFLTAAVGIVTILVFATVAFLLRSGWLFEKIRAGIVETVETATGGRVELGAFGVDWRKLRVEIRSFTLHGSEPAGKPPLFQASSIA